MKLKTHLKEAPIEVLRSIAEFWELRPDDPAALDDAPALADYLYPRLQTPVQFKAAFERLEVGEREIVYFLALHGGELPQEEFRRRTGLHEYEQFERVRQRLASRGFLWTERAMDEEFAFDLVGLPEPFVRLVDLPPYWRGFLGHYLQALGLDELKAIARGAFDSKYGGRRRQILVHHLREKLLDPASLRELIERRPPAERELFQIVHRRNGACVWRDLLDGGAQKKFNHGKAQALEDLTKSSGLVYVWKSGPNKYNNMVAAPRDLSHVIQTGFRGDERTLAELSGGSDRGRRAGAGARPNVILDNTQNILRDLAIFLACVRRRRVRMLNNGGVGRNDLKRIAPLLSHNKTPKYVSFLALFAMSRKLVVPVGDEWRVGKRAAPFLAGGRSAYFDLYDFWLNTSEWNEEFAEGDVVHVDVYPQNLVAIVEFRKLILRVLEKTPIDSWIDFDTFAESLLPQVALEIPGRFDHSPAERSNRHTILIMESIVAESLYWLGLVTLGIRDLSVARELGSRSNESVAPYDPTQPIASHLVGEGEYSFSFKPSALARQLFGGRYLDPPRATSPPGEADGLPYGPPSAHVTVQPNLEIVTPPDLGLDVFYELLAFSDVKKVDIVTTLVLSRESVRMGMEAGLRESDIVERLRAVSRRDLPETVLSLIEECASRHGEVDVGYAGGYISTADPMHVRELRANPRIERHVKDVFHEKLILLDRTADLKRIVRELERQGFVPHQSSDTLHVTGEGLFHVTVRPEELYKVLALLEFAKSLQEDLGETVFEGDADSLLGRLSGDLAADHNPASIVDPLVASYRKNYERALARKKDEEKRRLTKQVNRLLERRPRAKEPDRYVGENPASDQAEIAKMFRWAIEREAPVKIHYLRSTGEAVDEVVEPESLKGERLYAYCKDHDEHHIYYVKRIERAAL